MHADSFGLAAGIRKIPAQVRYIRYNPHEQRMKRSK
jgi:hypothetical protein